MWHSFTRFRVGAAAAVLAAAMVATAVWAQQPRPEPVGVSTRANRQGRQVSLHDLLRVGLKAKTEADLEFIDEVVEEVRQGDLPQKMVEATFLWARNRYKSRPSNHRLRPIVYFQPALTIQARRIGVRL